MYYRRKLLLALIEVFGGNLKRTDCQKLLFIFCQTMGKNHYDFFPYHYGAFSFIAYYDKRRLSELGLLKSTNDFQLSTSHSFLKEIETNDRLALQALHSQIGYLRGKKLIKKTYLEYPHFAARSKIVSGSFTTDEIKQLQIAWNTDTQPCLFTIGYEGLSIDAFLNKLITNNIAAVVDVRNNPQSMKYGFSKKSLGQYIENAGMNYIHIPELGIPSVMRKGLGTSLSHRSLFVTYKTELLPKQDDSIKRLKKLITENTRIALVCFEANHQFCHRHTLVEYLHNDKSFKTSVINL